jgi:Holliday junction resolvase
MVVEVGGLKSKRKGSAFERELVTLGRAFGLPSQRAWGSNGQSLGLAESVDLVIGEWKVQAKRRKKLPQFLRVPEGCDLVVTRMDNGESMVLLPFRRFLELVAGQKK